MSENLLARQENVCRYSPSVSTERELGTSRVEGLRPFDEIAPVLTGTAAPLIVPLLYNAKDRT